VTGGIETQLTTPPAFGPAQTRKAGSCGDSLPISSIAWRHHKRLRAAPTDLRCARHDRVMGEGDDEVLVEDVVDEIVAGA